MSSEWMKVMLDEIARKRSEANDAQAESERRRGEGETSPPAGAASSATASPETLRGRPGGGRPAGG